MIILNEIYKSFSQNKENINILENINIEIKLKDIITILGVSGSGKTTLLNIIAGIETYCSGSITKTKNLKIDYVAQNPHFIEELNMYDNLLFASYKYKNTNRINEYLDLFDCSHLKNKKPYYLSGGEKQRVNIIRALINNPDLLILDEPTSSLDFENKIKVSKILNYIRDNNDISIILVTHDKDIVDSFDNKKLFELKNKKLKPC